MILTKKRSFSASQKRFEGYKEALKKYDIPFDANLVMKFDGNLSSFDETKKVVDKLFQVVLNLTEFLQPLTGVHMVLLSH